MYRPSAFSPTFDCTVDFLTNNPIVINSSIGIDVLPLGGGYVLFESAYGGNCVFEYTSATAEGTTITLYCTTTSWAESNYYTDPVNPFSPTDSAEGTISRTITSADWNDIVDHVLNKNNPHDVSKSQVGLGNVDNTSDDDKPISNATREALNSKADLVNGKVPEEQLPQTTAGLELGTGHGDAYYGDLGQTAYEHSQLRSGNPHDVTKSDVGLSNVDNTSDANKPISNATQEALNSKADLVDGKVPAEQLPPSTAGLGLGVTHKDAYYGDLGQIAYEHSQLRSGNPHNVTKDEVGLGNVDNTSDLNKPISNATQQALNQKADQDSFDLLSSFVGYTPQTLIVSNPTQTAINAVQDNLDDHIGDNQNPHDVTKEQVGLGNVDNTSDMSKPISTATQQALNGKLNNSGFTGNAVIITNSQGGVEATPQASGFNKPFSDSMPLSPTISGNEGTDAYISRSDHQHPSETFTIADITVLSDDWVSDTTYIDFPYKATISNANVTSNHTPFVVFSQESVSLGIYAQVADTSNGTISIYASEIPSSSTVVKTIVLIRRIE